MKLAYTQSNGITVISVEGRLDATGAPQLETYCASLIESSRIRLILDLKNVDYISSAGLRVLLVLARAQQRVQGRLVLAEASPQVRQVMSIAGFDAIISVFDTVKDARADFAPADIPDRPDACPLSFAEELYLLALNDRDGAIKPMPQFAFDYALAGALLMELALDNRIDSDLALLKVTSAAPTGDPLLDETLEALRNHPEPQPTAFWLKQLADESRRIKQRVLESLIEKKVLREENRRILWVFEVRRYPMIDNREVKEVRTRLRELIAGDEIPSPRDVVMISLGNVCRLLDDMFSAEEEEHVHARMAALSRLDLIGLEMTEAIQEIEKVMILMAPSMMM